MPKGNLHSGWQTLFARESPLIGKVAGPNRLLLPSLKRTRQEARHKGELNGNKWARWGEGAMGVVGAGMESTADFSLPFSAYQIPSRA